MAIPAHLEQAVDGLDAAVFTGDTFVSPEARAWLREKLARLERGLAEHDRTFPAGGACERDTDGDGDCHLCAKTGGCPNRK